MNKSDADIAAEFDAYCAERKPKYGRYFINDQGVFEDPLGPWQVPAPPTPAVSPSPTDRQE